jgi:hypothetical protein
LVITSPDRSMQTVEGSMPGISLFFTLSGF